MLSPMERKKIGFPLLASSTAELKKYVDVYSLFVESGYTRELCDAYSDAFIDNAKKPAPFDILQLASFYDKIMDHKTAAFYLDKLTDKKLSGEERFDYCTGMLRTISKIGNWRDAEDFRTRNIGFLQKQAPKMSQKKQADLYIALSLADCAAKSYTPALKLLKFGSGMTAAEGILLLVGSAVAFIVSFLTIRFLMDYVKRHDFRPFAFYRIALGLIVLLVAAVGLI